MKEQLTFTSDPKELSIVRQRVRDFLDEAGVDDMEAELMILAIDEACTNIIRHAYHSEGGCPVHLDLESAPRTVRMRLRDYGQQCPPEKLVGRDLKDFKPGGIGLHIIRKAFDVVEFRRMHKGTQLRLTKRIRRKPS